MFHRVVIIAPNKPCGCGLPGTGTDTELKIKSLITTASQGGCVSQFSCVLICFRK